MSRDDDDVVGDLAEAGLRWSGWTALVEVGVSEEAAQVIDNGVSAFQPGAERIGPVDILGVGPGQRVRLAPPGTRL